MRAYLLLMVVAAAVTYLTTPLARWLALRVGAVTAVRDRDVHSLPTPRLGGVAILAGIAAGMVLASQLPFLAGVFEQSSEAWAILGGATLVCLLGAADDIWDLDWFTKLIGQVLAAGLMAWQGVQLYTLPVGGITIGSGRMWLVLTVLVVVVAINAVNFVDGLDGLAAGMIGIGGIAFFGYTYLLSLSASPTDYSSLASMVVAVLVGACIGFLPHNVHPARIFMGDSGSMVLGLTIASAAIVVTGQIDPEVVSQRQSIPAFLPMLLPFAVLLLPLLDMALAVLRRVGKGQSPFHPDRMHLHHRLLALGHSHRRAVLIMYVWTAVFAFGTAALIVVSTSTAWWVLGVGVLFALGFTVIRPVPTARRVAAEQPAVGVGGAGDDGWEPPGDGGRHVGGAQTGDGAQIVDGRQAGAGGRHVSGGPAPGTSTAGPEPRAEAVVEAVAQQSVDGGEHR